MVKIITFENLKQYHELLMRSLKNPHMVPINRCPQCGGIISETNVCEYCGTKLKLKSALMYIFKAL